MSESFPELLEERLEWPSLNVPGRQERLMAFDRIGIPYLSGLSKASLIKIGHELDADLLVVGDFDSDGRQIEASVSLLDLKKNLLRSTIKETESLEQFQLLCGRLGWKILSQIEPEFALSLDDYLARFPKIPNVALENYIRGLLESDRTKQIRFFRQADKAHSNYAKVIFQLGRLYHEEKDYLTSSLWLQRLLRLDSDALEASFLQGLNQLYLGSYDKAIAEFQRISRVIPLNEVNTNLGIALSLKGANDSAVEVLQKVIDADPTESDYSFNLAYHLWKTGDFAATLESLQKGVQRLEADGDAHYLRYKCYQALGRPLEAAAAWRAAKELSPKVETWESRRQMPDLFRIQTSFDESSYRQLQLQIRQVQESKDDIGGLSSPSATGKVEAEIRSSSSRNDGK
jgi:tetratricopeptide (TPR) repeat protein